LYPIVGIEDTFVLEPEDRRRLKIGNGLPIRNLAMFGNFSAGVKGLSTLQPGQWLSNDPIDLFGLLDSQTCEDCHYIPSCSYTYYRYFVGARRHPSSSFSWDDTLAQETLAKKVWICSINHNDDHWQLLVILKPGEEDCCGLLMDSLVSYSAGRTRYPSNWRKVREFSEHYIQSVLVKAGMTRHCAAPLMKLCYVPNQPNSFDCGVFSLLNLKNVVFHIEELERLGQEIVRKPDFIVDCRWWYTNITGTEYRKYLFHRYNELCSQFAS
jgi:Ulp1 family protease